MKNSRLYIFVCIVRNFVFLSSCLWHTEQGAFAKQKLPGSSLLVKVFLIFKNDNGIYL